MADRNIVAKNEEHAIVIKNYFTFRDRPNAERVNNLKAHIGVNDEGQDYVHLTVENGINQITREEKKCSFRMDLETAKVLKNWLDKIIGH